MLKVGSFEQLKEILLLRDLSDSDITTLQPCTAIHLYQKGGIVMLEGDKLPAKLHILMQGMLQLTRIGTSGKETLLRTLSANEIFAAPALFGDEIAPATVTAIIESQVLTIERSALLERIKHTPEVAFRILEVYNQRLQQMHQTIHDLVSERAIVRLARFLQAHLNSDSEELNIKLSHHQIARSIGITYEECVRLFSQLKSVVSYQRGGKITILNLEMLTKIANGLVDLKFLNISDRSSSKDSGREA
jgi:CRP/FNR family transcriptional regulator, cyclic AMP receptor protein